MNKYELALKIINEYLKVFNIDKIDNLHKIPKLEKSLFDHHKLSLNEIIDENIDELRNTYTPYEISFYQRKIIINYPYTLFKKLYESNKINIKTKKHFKKLANNNFTSVTYLYV